MLKQLNMAKELAETLKGCPEAAFRFDHSQGHWTPDWLTIAAFAAAIVDNRREAAGLEPNGFQLSIDDAEDDAFEKTFHFPDGSWLFVGLEGENIALRGE